jgi:hypothetical protein
MGRTTTPGENIAKMKQEYQCRITSTAPILMHNGQLADPLNPFAKAMKAISSKRDKTEADFEELARLEWHGGLYLHAGKPCLPGEVLEATLINAAKKRKKGLQAKAGLICPENFPLLYDGPQEIEALWKQEDFRFTVPCIVNRGRIMRTRAIFRMWQADITILFNDEMLNRDEISRFIQIGGEMIGVGDWRPRFGRFALA